MNGLCKRLFIRRPTTPRAAVGSAKHSVYFLNIYHLHLEMTYFSENLHSFSFIKPMQSNKKASIPAFFVFCAERTDEMRTVVCEVLNLSGTGYSSGPKWAIISTG